MKNKKIYICLLFMLQMPFAFAQTPSIAVEYLVTVNTKNVVTSTRSTNFLHILKDESIYFKDPKDSLKQFIHGDPNNMSILSREGRVSQVKLSDNSYAPMDMIRLYKNYTRDTLILNEIMVNRTVVFGESLSIFNWTILQDKDTTILGYPCQMATTDFRGRRYKAYFSPKINNFGGPWKFEGLPGLILQVESMDNYLTIEPQKIVLNATFEPVKNPYTDAKEPILSGWESFREAQIDKLIKNYKFMMASMPKTSGSSVSVSIDTSGGTIEDLGIGVIDAATIRAMENTQKEKETTKKKKKKEKKNKK